MTRKRMLVADLLCGAGGSSTGCARALRELGLTMELVCVNHWPVAIETHTRNHPEARHYVEDIAAVRPHLLVPEGYLDLLVASPTCTHHSVARGGKPTSDQQRSDPWHIVTWLTELRVKRIIIENVPEFVSWGPVDPRTGKPVKARKGEYFRQWIATLRGLGFEVEWRILNAADFGDATTRRRFILMGRSDGKPIAWPVPTHRKREVGALALFPGMKPWTPARDIIDWSIRGRSIFGRRKPLAAKTLARIYAGAVKFGWPEPFLVVLRNHMAGQSVEGPLPTIAAKGQHIGLAEPVVFTNRNNNAPRSPDDPAPVFTTAPGGGVAIAEPFIVKQGFRRDVVPIDDPAPTVTTIARIGVVEPFVLNRHGDNGGVRAHSVDDPIPTAVDRGAGYLVEPFIATVAHGNEAGDATADTRRVKSIEEPIGAVPAGGGTLGVVEAISAPRSGEDANRFGWPFVLSRQGEGAPRAVGEPIPSQTTVHSPVLISPYYGSGSGETCATAEDPLPTVTAKARFGMVVPVTHADGSNRARDVEDDPLPTLTAANRGELAFITAQHGEREGQAPRVHDVGAPAPTIAAKGHIDLVIGSVGTGSPDQLRSAEREAEGEGQAQQSYDILFRMLEPHELAAAMGFTSGDAAYDFAGTKTEQIKQIGNAVSVSKMKACVRALMADAAVKRTETTDAAGRKVA